MTSLRHIALGCCVLSALAGILRLFWPENGFKSVINAVLVLYILTVGVHSLDEPSFRLHRRGHVHEE